MARLIDADALLRNNGLDNAVKYGNNDVEQRDKSYSTMMLYEIAYMIEDAPTIEAEPVRHGRWENSPTGSTDYKYCSECGGCFYVPSLKAFYCPWCGARMDAEPPESEVQDDEQRG